MAGMTVAEKILSRHAGTTVRADDLTVIDVDAVMMTDTTAPLAIKAFREMGGTRPWNPERTHLVIDHASPAPNERIARLHGLMREFASATGAVLYDVGRGICHQLMIEEDRVRPGEAFFGADSHTCTYGALGAFATGVGSTDLAAIMLTGKTWLKVPKTIRLEVTGRINPGVEAKDLALAMVGTLGFAGATYQAVEICGDAISPLSLDERMTIANLGIEMGAKAALVHPAGLELPYAFDAEAISPDPDAAYVRRLTIDGSALRPQISKPPRPDATVDIDELIGTEIDVAFIGTCVNGRLRDLHAAARILKGRRAAPGVRLMVSAASQKVFLDATRDGTIATLAEAGATFLPSGCGPCVGTHLGVPGDGEVVVSTANRNFRGRMGNPEALVYLASPTVVAAAAVAGKIIDPQDLVEGE
ncbi:MAG TPA: 3-isopropylmalate dehydratase large subunit [Methylomirabilota bacterium]|nr:3-isopropylmalate dehydratase large subunit [Methylomirabilota bacterium]